eukprot:scaffold2643_cov387-Prasinococcus_capsulatus_cf.AAC.11
MPADRQTSSSFVHALWGHWPSSTKGKLARRRVAPPTPLLLKVGTAAEGTTTSSASRMVSVAFVKAASSSSHVCAVTPSRLSEWRSLTCWPSSVLLMTASRRAKERQRAQAANTSWSLGLPQDSTAPGRTGWPALGLRSMASAGHPPGKRASPARSPPHWKRAAAFDAELERVAGSM